ncbi:MAG TPA: anthranilate phosphoribosyltransferase [Candidatus Binatia bacterium]|nr:anthranilate phosphoribosyltransferase [Candidatus Binatia bacterium]
MSELVRAALAAVVEGRTLGFDEARRAIGAVMDGEATPAQLAGLLVALRMRGETVEELAGFAAAMRERALRVEAPPGTIDVVGTGGDGSRTFNISTAAALVVAAAGVPVAKHGNRAITSAAGSADVLDALGVRIDHDPASAATAIRSLGFAFLFAPGFHPAMRHAMPTRRELGLRTAFNLLGPLTNPAGVGRLVVGAGDPTAAPKLAEVLRFLGAERAFVVHGDGVDELPLDGSGVLYAVGADGIERSTVDPTRFGLRSAPTAALAGGSPAENAALVEAVLRGVDGVRRDVVLLNAAVAFVVAGRAEDIAAGLDLARATIDGGRAAALLDRLREERRQAEEERRRAEEERAAAESPTAAESRP